MKLWTMLRRLFMDNNGIRDLEERNVTVTVREIREMIAAPYIAKLQQDTERKKEVLNHDVR